MASNRKRLPGSEFVPLAGSHPSGGVAGDTELRVTVVLKARGERTISHDHPRFELPPHRRPPLEEHEVKAGWASSSDLELVRRFAEDHGLTVLESSRRWCTVDLSGTAAQVESAFGVELVQYGHQRGDYRGFAGAVHLPGDLHGVVEGVLGLHDRPRARSQLCGPGDVGSPAGRLQATALAEFYGFPPDLDGAGQTIGIIELSDERTPAGYRSSDIEVFRKSLNLPQLKIRDRVLRGAVNAPAPEGDVAAFMEWLNGTATSPGQAPPPPTKGKDTVEVTMDIELIAALAPGAEIIVYFAPDDDDRVGLYNALKEILSPGGPSVVSFSWAWEEEQQGTFEKLISNMLAEAAEPTRGGTHMTFCAASGDYGGSKVCFPAASPWVLSCGGTGRTGNDPSDLSEEVWNTRPLAAASGGGASRYCKRPKWQKGLSVPGTGRGIPDVAMLADPASNCAIYAGGTWGPAAGTSAAAPMWASLVARINQGLGAPQGYLNPRLYKLGVSKSDAFRSVVTGDNIVDGAGYHARAGWDPCTGWGSPNGTRLLAAMRDGKDEGGQQRGGSG